MNINYQNLLIFTLVIIATLLTSLLLDRWWRERIYNLNGKTVLITGGSRGLGLVMARQLIQAGARLAICARVPQELERSRIELEQRGGEVLAIPCDVTDKTQVEQMIQQVRDRFGAIDILINNAGTDFVGPDEQSAQEISLEMPQVYQDIKQTLGVPIVNSDYQALARWPVFFLAAWSDIKLWRKRPEYQLLVQDVVQKAEEATSRLSPAVWVGEREE
ncbi:SDR family NAD(P)-dependent oxidoreductase [uncultured Nostoc sp.]|uniref:SDR family NAD(P)-dependent oxidoreductase n=1 Tax=uncultured Nostoc sp. TaxID=340711 RepID=UPI0035CC82CF